MESSLSTALQGAQADRRAERPADPEQIEPERDLVLAARAMDVLHGEGPALEPDVAGDAALHEAPAAGVEVVHVAEDDVAGDLGREAGRHEVDVGHVAVAPADRYRQRHRVELDADVGGGHLDALPVEAVGDVTADP